MLFEANGEGLRRVRKKEVEKLVTAMTLK